MKRYQGIHGMALMEAEFGDYVRFEDAQEELDTHLKVHLLVLAENKRLRDELTAANLERDALKQDMCKATSLVEVTGPGQRPQIVLTFENLDEMRDASNSLIAIRLRKGQS